MSTIALPRTSRVPLLGFNIGAASNLLIDGSSDTGNNAIAAIFRAPKDGTIDRIGSGIVGAITGTPTYDFRIESPDATTKWKPSGTLLGTGSNVTKNPAGGLLTGYNFYTIGTPIHVNAGDYFCVVVHATSADGSNKATFQTVISFYAPEFPVQSARATTTWTAVSGLPTLSARYDSAGGDEIVFGSFPGLVSAGAAYKNSSTPNEIGVEWIETIAMNLIGCMANVAMYSVTATLNLNIYKDTVNQATVAFAAERMRNPTSSVSNLSFFPLANGPLLTVVGSTYRITLEATAAEYLKQLVYSFPDTGARDVSMGKCYKCSASGSHVFDASDPLSSQSIYPVFDSVVIPDVAGGGLPILGHSLVR